MTTVKNEMRLENNDRLETTFTIKKRVTGLYFRNLNAV